MGDFLWFASLYCFVCVCVYVCVFRFHLLNVSLLICVIYESSLCPHTSVGIICHHHALVLFSLQQIRKLRRELENSQEKVANLTNQLSANVRTLKRLLVITSSSLWSFVYLPR